MIALRIVTVTLVAIAMLACTVATTPTVAMTPTTSPSAIFLGEMGLLSSELGVVMGNFTELMGSAQVGDEIWRTNTQSTIAELEALDARISSLTPPSDFQIIYNSFSLAAKHYALAGLAVSEILVIVKSENDRVANAMFQKAVNELKLGNAQIEKASELMQAYSELLGPA